MSDEKNPTGAQSSELVPEAPPVEPSRKAPWYRRLFRKPVPSIYSDSSKEKKNIFYNNYFLLVFSVLVAFGIWVGLAFSDTTTEATRTIRGVPLQYDNLTFSTPGLKVIDTSGITTVDVVITGKQYLVNQMTASDLIANLRLSDVTVAGTYTAEIRVTTVSKYKAVSVRSVDPQIVNVRVDRMVSREFPLEVQTNSYSPADGYTLKLPTLSATTVDVSGTASNMEQVVKVVAVAEVPDTIKATASYAAKIKIYNKLGEDITDLFQLSTEETQLTIVAMQLKTVPLQLECQNGPSNAADLITLQPKEVQLSLPSDLYESLNAIDIGSLDFSKVNTNNARFDFDLKTVLPDGSINESGMDTVTATVNLSGMVTKTYDVTNISTVSAAADQQVDVLTSSVSITITGPESEMEKITEKDITLRADLSSNPTNGKYEIPVKAVIRGGDGCWVYGSPTVFVQISDRASSR